MMLSNLLQRLSIRFLKRPKVDIEAIAFNWYTDIVDSGLLNYIQKVINVYQHSFRCREWHTHSINHIQPCPDKRNQVGSFEKKSREDIHNITLSHASVIEKEKEAAKNSFMQKLPIILIHLSNSDYLKYSLGQAKLSNPGSKICLIGDDSNDCYDFVEHHALSDYFQGACEFSKTYKHFNTSDYNFELFNFQRWLILNEFLITNKLTECFYMDSDILLYADITEEQKKFAQYYFTVCNRDCGNIFFLNSAGALADLCKFLADIYTNKGGYYYNRMLAHYATFRKSGMYGGACDNTAFDFYCYERLGEIGDTAQIIDDSVYDPSIDLPTPGFVMENGIKKVIWKNGNPYGMHLRTGKEIKFNSLHFRFNAKRLMSQYCTRESNEG